MNSTHCQILADFQTIAEHRGGVDNLKNQTIAYLGDAANNMSNSYLLGGAVAGMNVRVAGPNGYLPDPQIVADAEAIASENGGSVLVTTDPKEAVAGADCVFTDTWVSMGEEAEYAIRSKPFWDYQVNAELMSYAKEDAIFQHCLPAYRGKEVTSEVIDGPQSVVWDEAGNRLHAQKALLTWLAGKGLAAMKACWPDDGPNACAATSCHTGRSIERHRAGVADVHRYLAVAAVSDSRGPGHRGDPGHPEPRSRRDSCHENPFG